MTLLMDFDEPSTRHKTASFDNLLEYDDVRISLASMSSRYSEDSRYSARVQSTATNESIEYEHLKPCLLTIEALRHYKKHHNKNFYQSQVEEKIYEPGIIASSERVVRMLAKILHVGMDPDRSSACYQPTIFTCSSKTPFFFELFSRTMWLLSKTRREMKASTIHDYDKVVYVLSKQVKLVLDEKPMDLKKLTEKFAQISYQTVMEIWQKEKEEELKNVFEHNPSVKVLKKRFRKQNEQIIYKQRMNYIKTGTMFPKIIEKKINGNFVAKLAPDERNLLVNDYNVITKTAGDVQVHSLADVTHIVEGKACPHVINNTVKDPQLAFSILLNNSFWINFKGADKKMASYWCDALNLLLHKDNRSSYYENELKELVEMDLVLHLIELQNVTIPKKAPPVPRPPFEMKPVVPPKPKNYPGGVK
ncbi:hypothetical protein Zmor_002549 [Zophobas morio]|uniref:PH domain-containing protein n=2 Tax=Zophobas morio TaxID=2755281 RepID=A0AA38MTQ9_9CUCU|nr:hypothetical protein Zmor_002549 [Zophobas morio]